MLLQENLLKLRERALREKTAAELAWLQQQKSRIRDKGADDQFPQLNKRRRGVLLRLQQEKVRPRVPSRVAKQSDPVTSITAGAKTSSQLVFTRADF